MFDIGFAELFLIAIIALLILGPERLPSFIHSLGKMIGQAKRIMYNMQVQIEHEANKVTQTRSTQDDTPSSATSAKEDHSDPLNHPHASTKPTPSRTDQRHDT